MSTFRVFAYGSNLCVERLRARTPSARVIAVARLTEHALQFHKRGYDGSAKADAFFTGGADDGVFGVVYEIARTEKPILDRCERGYDQKSVRVLAADGTPFDAMTYAAKPERIDPTMQPFVWYKRFVVTGARQHSFPDAYVRRVESIPAIDDTDRERHLRESAVLQALSPSRVPPQ